MDINARIRIAATVLCLSAFVPLTSAQDVTPQAGTWAIDEEVNGEPGRGFQMDIQNDVLVLYFYGYEPSGESTYWLAAGTFQKGSNELTMDLGAYAGGMAFGDPFKNATYLGPQGKVTIRFSGIAHGEICLPNESCKAISAFNFGYPDSAEAVLGAWLVHFQHIVGNATEDLDSIELDLLDVVGSSDPEVVDIAIGEAVTAHNGTVSVGELSCDRLVNPNPAEFRCKIDGLSAEEDYVLYFSPRRNAFLGEYYDPQGQELLGQMFGFRVQSSSARFGMPN